MREKKKKPLRVCLGTPSNSNENKRRTRNSLLFLFFFLLLNIIKMNSDKIKRYRS